jgi:hypothetical protein
VPSNNECGYKGAVDPVFNERKLRAWLEPLSHRQRVAFALSRCERQRPSQRQVLDHAWTFVERGVRTADDVELTDTILSLLRQTIASGSLDDVIAIAAATAEAAEARAALDLGLTDDRPEVDPRIAGHTLVQQELRRQRDDIRLLRRTDLERADQVRSLKRNYQSRTITDSDPEPC